MQHLLASIQDSVRGVKKSVHLSCERQLAQPRLGTQTSAEGDKTPHIARGYDGQTLAHQCIVCIVPLWALRVHPDALSGRQVGQLGQQQRQPLFRQVDVKDTSIGVQDQLAVCSHLVNRFLNPLIQRAVENDRVVPVFQQRPGERRVDSLNPMCYNYIKKI